MLYAWNFPNHDYWATAVFCVAMTTDWFDGRLARRQGRSSSVGTLLDPIADKILVLAALVMLIEQGVAPAWMVAAIVVREVLVTGLRQAAIERGVVLAARDLGKLKTWAQAVAAAVGRIRRCGRLDATVQPGGRCSSRSSSPGSRGSTTRAALRGSSAALSRNSVARQAAIRRASHQSSKRAHARRYSRRA